MQGQKILIVDDEIDIVEFLSYNLEKAGFQVATANNGRTGIAEAIKFKPDLIILDVMMPEMDGIEACQELRNIKITEDALIIFLSARNEDYSQIAGFDAGADDYVNKPINPNVLISRIKALLKRNQVESIQESRYQVSEDIIIDSERYHVIRDGEPVILPKKEFELLRLLASKPQKVFSREEIYDKIWGDAFVGDRTIDVHIRKLREKFGQTHIKTIKGVGYKFINE